MASHHRHQASYEGAYHVHSQQPPQPHHRHQTSLEGAIDFASPRPLLPAERAHAKARFESMIECFGENPSTRLGFKRDLLIHHTYEYSRSEVSKDMFLRYFFNFIEQDITSDKDIILDDALMKKLTDMADSLLDHFYLPLKATGRHTPQPSPAHLSAIRELRSPHDVISTPGRLALLRTECLVRDHWKCVISHVFHVPEAMRRMDKFGHAEAKDDEGQLITGLSHQELDVAHIIPHSLTQTNDNLGLSTARRNSVEILNMFDCGVMHLINGRDIDRPRNALSLTSTQHVAFGNFTVYLEAVADQEHTYDIKCFNPTFSALFRLPRRQTLFLTPDQSIEPPSPRLLALHCAIAKVLHLSGAGEYIDKILRDLEETGIRADGGTDLGRLLNLGLGGWLDGAVDVY